MPSSPPKQKSKSKPDSTSLWRKLVGGLCCLLKVALDVAQGKHGARELLTDRCYLLELLKPLALTLK